MLIPTVDMKEFEKAGFKKCKKPYDECYYLCVAKGIQMIFLSPVMVDIIKWKDDDPRIHKRKGASNYKRTKTSIKKCIK